MTPKSPILILPSGSSELATKLAKTLVRFVDAAKKAANARRDPSQAPASRPQSAESEQQKKETSPFSEISNSATKSQAKNPVPENLNQAKVTTKPLRATTFTSRYYFRLSVSLWHWILLSLPLDFVLLLLDFSFLRKTGLVEVLQFLLVPLFLVCFLMMARDRIVTFLLQADTTQTKLASFASKHSVLIICVISLAVFLDLAWKIGKLNPVSVIATLAIVLGAARSIKRTMAAHQAHSTRLEEDLTFWIEQTNHKVFLLSLAPLIAARLISLLGGLDALIEFGPGPLFFLYMLIATLLLFSHMPLEKHFMITCQSCGITTSVILKKSGLCPMCKKRREATKGEKGKST